MAKGCVVVDVLVWRPAGQGDEVLAKMVARAVEAALWNVFALLELGGLADGRECDPAFELGTVVLAGALRYRVGTMQADDGKERE